MVYVRYGIDSGSVCIGEFLTGSELGRASISGNWVTITAGEAGVLFLAPCFIYF